MTFAVAVFLIVDLGMILGLLAVWGILVWQTGGRWMREAEDPEPIPSRRLDDQPIFDAG